MRCAGAGPHRVPPRLRRAARVRGDRAARRRPRRHRQPRRATRVPRSAPSADRRCVDRRDRRREGASPRVRQQPRGAPRRARPLHAAHRRRRGRRSRSGRPAGGPVQGRAGARRRSRVRRAVGMARDVRGGFGGRDGRCRGDGPPRGHPFVFQSRRRWAPARRRGSLRLSVATRLGPHGRDATGSAGRRGPAPRAHRQRDEPGGRQPALLHHRAGARLRPRRRARALARPRQGARRRLPGRAPRARLAGRPVRRGGDGRAHRGRLPRRLPGHRHRAHGRLGPPPARSGPRRRRSPW